MFPALGRTLTSSEKRGQCRSGAGNISRTVFLKRGDGVVNLPTRVSMQVAKQARCKRVT